MNMNIAFDWTINGVPVLPMLMYTIGWLGCLTLIIGGCLGMLFEQTNGGKWYKSPAWFYLLLGGYGIILLKQ